MDFFRSIFSAEPNTSISQESPRGLPDHEHDRGGEDDLGGETLSPSSTDSDIASAWNFEGLIKTFASKSESVIRTYRRDLAEFGTGFRKETAALREAAARAVLDLPGSLDAGASVAQESLESVGQALDELGGSVWRGTAEIISQGKEAILSVKDGADNVDEYSTEAETPSSAAASRLYSRYEMQVLSIQSDVTTFTDEPEDTEDFCRWRLEFDLTAKEQEIENLCYESGALEEFHNKLVPGVVDYETFWCRYYYRLHKLKQAEDARSNLVRRVISQEEDLSWDVDDDNEGEEEEKAESLGKNADVNKVEQEGECKDKHAQLKLDHPSEQKSPGTSIVENLQILGSEVDLETLTSQNSENTQPTGGTVEAVGSSKDSDFSVISSQNSTPEEDDLGWDEIEDIGENDDKKTGVSNASPLKLNLRKGLIATEEGDDLSWDIEDDDEPSKH